MRYLDITRPLVNNMRRYPTDPPVRVTVFKSLDRGNSCNLSRLQLGTHSGTHIDAPHHILHNYRTADKLPIKNFFCRVLVMAPTKQPARLTSFLRTNKIQGVLLKKNLLSAPLAKIFLAARLIVVGVEQLSIESGLDHSHPLHRILLKRNVVLLENLNLTKVRPGIYQLVYLPLLIKNSDGSPCRAILIKNVHD